MEHRAYKKNIISKILKPSRTRYKKRTFLRIFSYSLVICIVLLLLTVGALYYSFSTIVTREIHNKSIELLNQTRLVFSSLHAWTIPSFRQIRSEVTINPLIMSGDVEDLEISKGLDRLDTVMSSYYLLHSIYIYNNRSGFYYSTINGREGAECSDITLPAIVHNIRKYGVYRYIPRKIIYTVNGSYFNADRNEVKTENVFSVIIGDMPDSGNTINGALVVNISEKKLREYFLGINSASSRDMLIIDRNGIVITHPDKDEFGKNYGGFPYIRRILASAEAQGVFSARINGKKNLVSYITHNGPDWRFINVLPYEIIFANMNAFLKNAVLVFIVLLMLAFLLSLFSSVRVYSPIKRLFSYSQSLKDRQLLQLDSDNANNLSELQAFDRLFKQIVKKVQDTDHNLEDYREFSKTEIIRNLLLGEMKLADVSKHMDLVNSVLDRGPYMLAVIRIDNFQNLQETLSGEDIRRLFSILKELLFHSISCPHFFLHMRNETACVVCNLRSLFTGSEADSANTVSQFRSLQTGIKARIGTSITIGLGDVFAEVDEFPAQYKTVFMASHYCFSFGHDAIIRPTDISGREKKRYLLPEEKISRLFQDIRMGETSGTEKLLTEIINDAGTYKYEDFNYLRHFLVYSVRKLVEDLKDRLVTFYVKLNEMIEVTERLETAGEITKAFSEILLSVSASLQDTRNGKTRELAEKIRSHIDGGFTDKNLCSESIADQLGFSTQYIRFIFKDIYDISIIEYINTSRIEYCKHQLLETRMPLKRIFQNAGYSNYSYFFTLFKKATGMTPNQFRLRSK